MYRIQNITHTIANLVTEIALSFPVAYINTISFFNEGSRVAKCDWKEENGNIIRIGMLQPAYYTVYNSGVSYSDVEITGIDIQGEPFRILYPAGQSSRPATV